MNYDERIITGEKPFKPYRVVTANQKAAMKRNWKIRNLRALYGLCYQLDEDLGLKARKLIDTQLERIGAEKETDRRDVKNT